ncbi:ABC transporter permease [Carboxydochorda subterranea]|uniref:ABC transporter permease n=1 Tax=Carboxydichorda subterranea TaxID=3109565 RepID=A0ABZ1BYG5_9FIRM|nr:ABC transporter permease [Limnochorda sp. L945t]WRP17570.1 ABC transporter permease [Limnochorda sp. L945t]
MWLVAPALTFLGLFFLIPLALVLGGSFYEPGTGLTWAAYGKVVGDPVAQRAFWRTLRVAGVVTLLAVLLCYPAAYAASRVTSPARRTLLVSLVILPLMTSPVARTYAWLVVMGRYGLINESLRALQLASRPVPILYTETAVVVGLLQLFSPLMMLALMSAFENVPREVVLAARSLGASEWQLFRRVLVPLTAEGLVVGGTLVFTGSVTAYVTPAVLGGPRQLLLSTLLYQKASVTLDWQAATVIAVIMLATTLAASTILRRGATASAARGRPA